MNSRMKHTLGRMSALNHHQNHLRFCTLLFLLFAGVNLPAQNVATADDDMINQYYNAQNDIAHIVFSASDIKQYWVDNSVLSKDNLIYIFGQNNGQNWQSVPLSIQLKNVDESLDCTISAWSDNKDFSFAVSNSKAKKLSKSSATEDFVQYHIVSSTFHLADTKDNLFKLQFESDSSDTITIKKIVLSFSKNKDGAYLSSPDTLYITKDIVTPSAEVQLDDNEFAASGKKILLTSNKNIIVPYGAVKSSVTIHNIGETATKVSVGYALFSKGGQKLGPRNYLYNLNCNVLTVVSSEVESDKIIVAGTSDWAKKCQIATNVKEDLSDIPNTNFLEGKVANVKKLEDGKLEITLDKPLKQALNTGEKIRIHGIAGTYLFPEVKTIQPGAEESFVSTISREVLNKSFNSKSIPYGVYYMKPIIQSNSVKADEVNTIQVIDYSVFF